MSEITTFYNQKFMIYNTILYHSQTQFEERGKIQSLFWSEDRVISTPQYYPKNSFQVVDLA